MQRLSAFTEERALAESFMEAQFVSLGERRLVWNASISSVQAFGGDYILALQHGYSAGRCWISSGGFELTPISLF